MQISRPLKKILLPYKPLFRIFLSGLLLFTIYRLAFAWFNRQGIPDHPDDPAWLWWRSLLYGFNFDIVVLCYLTAPFLVFIFCSSLFKTSATRGFTLFKIYFLLVFSIAFLICCADIPWYQQFGSHLNRDFSLWMGSPQIVSGLIFSNFSYWGFLVFFAAGCLLNYRSISRIFREPPQSAVSSRPAAFIIFLVLGLFTFVGLRGRTSAKAPISAGTAFFSEHYYFNQLGQNPCFIFVKSITDHKSSLPFPAHEYSDKELHDAAKKLSLPRYGGQPYISAIQGFSRQYTFEQPPLKSNVIIVLMESMSRSKMGAFGCRDLTPNLDSLSRKGVFFDNFYSAGIHTFNGIFSVETGFPAVMDIHPLNTYNAKAFKGISYWLRENGYRNYFFTSHDPQFDNMEGFMKFNYFDRVFSVEDYPASQSLSTLGVPDLVQFNYLLERMDEHVSNQSSPFFSMILTSSDHTPWIIPDNEGFVATSSDKGEAATEYADWALGKFMKSASQKSWFANTLFIFVADHGLNLGHTYAMPLSYNSIPCIFYQPKLLKPDTVKQLAGQIDIFPTLMSQLRIPFVNNSFGIDVLHESRPYMYFTADSKIGCIDHEDYYIHLPDENRELLYSYHDLSTINHLPEKRARADSMRKYSEEMIRLADYILTNKKY